MTNEYEERLDPELEGVAERLRQERPLADPDLLERVRLSVRSRARRGGPRAGRRPRGELMKSRIAVTAVLVLGILMMATSAGLAVSGAAGGGSAGKAQYFDTPVVPDIGPGGGGKEGDSGGGTLGEGGGSVLDDSAGSQDARQAGSGSGDELPFTGFVAIFLLVAGVGLLATGLVLRRRTQPDGGRT